MRRGGGRRVVGRAEKARAGLRGRHREQRERELIAKRRMRRNQNVRGACRCRFNSDSPSCLYPPPATTLRPPTLRHDPNLLGTLPCVLSSLFVTKGK